MQKWKKLGNIFQPTNENAFLKSHATNPLAIHISENIYRIFYSGRNVDNKSSVGYIDIDIETLKIIDYPQEPLCTFGLDDTFYSHGISIGNLYSADNKEYMLFMGWQYPQNQHWRGDIGRLELLSRNTLSVNPEQVFMGIDEDDEISLSYPFVIFHEGIYKMWYGSTLTWEAGNNEMIHIIKYATSKDSIRWEKHGIAIPYEIGVAQAFSKPSVIIDSKGYHMWFSYRSGAGTTYRIGYAYSKNGWEWDRQETKSGISISESGWDSEMICYPYIFDHKEKRYMLYNGNGYGKTGFGLAILEQD